MIDEEPLAELSSFSSTGRKLAAAAVFFALLIAGCQSQDTTHASPLVQSAEAKNPIAATESNLALGLSHFDAHCASCHGSFGKADSTKGKTVRAADLTLQRVQSKSDRELFDIVAKGVAGTAMPAFGKTHSPTEIWHAVLFLRKLPTLTPEERKKLEAAVPPEARHHQDAGHDHHVEGGENHHEEPQTDPHHERQAQAPSPQQRVPEHHHDLPEADEKEKVTKPQGQMPPAHQHEVEPPPQHSGGMKHDMSKTNGEQTGHDMSAMSGTHDMHTMMTTNIGGPFKAMQAIGSGTSLLPATSPMNMWHWMAGNWMIMSHANLIVDFNHQGGPRGVNKAESMSWFMLMAERNAGPGQLMLRGMFSAEPFTSPNGGFPALLQTGETWKGRPIIDAQHPHDLFMELAAAYTLPVTEHISLNFYGGPIGEPALGPVAFMHRASASEDPAAPLSHHWQDSTHISYGVLTAGITAWRFRLESSLFHGAEPDENRKNIEAGKLDSWSGRIWFTPAKDWAMQFSFGHLVHPEALEPGNLKRMTASVTHNRSWKDGNWASTMVWGRNHEAHGNSNAYLFESTVNFLDKNYLYTRGELVDKPGLLEENIFGRAGLDQFQNVDNRLEPGPLFDRFFRVGAFTIGGVRDIVTEPKWRLGIGADATFYHLPNGLKTVYGPSPTSFHVFLRFRPGKMSH